MKNKLLFIVIILILYFMNSCDDVTAPRDDDFPQDLDIEVLTNNKLQLTWEYYKVNEDTLVFHIARKVGEEGWNDFYAEVEGDVYEFIDNDVSTIDNRVYAYKVRYFNVNQQEYSQFSEPIAYFSPFTYPTDLQIEQISQNEVAISWIDNCIGEEGYKIDKKLNDEEWIDEYLILNANSNSIIDQNAIFDTLNYRIYAYLGISRTEKLQDTLFTTLMAPSNLTTTSPDDNKIRLEWIDNSQSEENFIIDKKEGELDWLQNYATVDSNVTTYVDDTYLQCGTLQYRVKAVQANIASAYSNIDTINVRLNIVGTLTTPGQAQQVFIPEWTAFVADNYAGLAVVDCNNPNAPNITQTYGLPDRTLSVFINSNFAYVATHSGTSTPGNLFILDITDLDNPITTGFASTQGIPKHLYSEGDYAFIAEGSNGLSVMYIAASTPGYVANYQLEDARKVFVNQYNIAFVANGLYGTAIINVNNPTDPIFLSDITTNGLCNDVHADGSYLYIADGEEGLNIYDVSNYSNPQFVKNISTGGFVYGVYAEDDHVYLADKEKGLYVIDATQPSNAYILGNLKLDNEPNSIHLSGSYVYITDEIGLKIIQVKE